RIDLAQAEAVADLIAAVAPLQARAAMDQLEGTLTAEIAKIEDALFSLTARLEASLDFPDEGFHFIARAEVVAEIDQIRSELARLREDGRAGRVIREGSLVVLAGRPNAGKSSLFNALVGSARAIVTDVPGTTRDLLTERVDIGGLPVTVVDTAGLRETGDVIEAEGVLRARQAQSVATLTLVLIDAGQPLSDEDREQAADRASRIVVVTKIDRPRAWQQDELAVTASDSTVELSLVTGEGLERLKTKIVSKLTDREEWRDVPAISNVRHLALVDAALASIERVGAAVDAGATEELVIAEITDARQALEEITGRRTSDDLLRHIFSRFCVGK
ncbi:MAG: GTPase, partial [Acidobacteriota bacterium]